MAEPARTVFVSARGISKQFAAVEVLRDVDLDLMAGEIHALLGENGAGKSTFAKILAGVYRPSRGTLSLGGRQVDIASPIVAQELGITLIHQEPISFPDLSVAENLVLGRDQGAPLARVDWAAITSEARRLMDLLGVRIDVSRPMRGLSIADQQMVEIARALASDSRLIIMDEPTAPLTPREVETLFSIVRRLRDEGRTIVFISHRLEEVRALCDRVTIFRDGSKVATHAIGELDDSDIIRLMIGRPLKEFLHKTRATVGEVALEVEGLTLPGVFSDIGFQVRRGEIVGLGGLVGAGRTDVARALFGIAPAASGRILVDGKPVEHPRPVRRHRARDRLRARGPGGGGDLPHALGGREHHRRHPPTHRAARLHPPRARADARLGVGPSAAHPARVAAPADRRALGRQPAEGHPRALAAHRPAHPDPRRADPRHRHRRQGRVLRPDRRARRRRPRHPADLLGAPRAPGALRPRAGHVGGTAHRRHPARRGHPGGDHARRRAAHRPGGCGVNRLGSVLRRREAGIFVAIVVFCIVVGLIKPRFLTLDNLRVMLLLVPLLMIAAMGQMLVLIARHVDISIGSTLGFSAMVVGLMFKFVPAIPWWLGFPVAIGTGDRPRARQRRCW